MKLVDALKLLAGSWAVHMAMVACSAAAPAGDGPSAGGSTGSSGTPGGKVMAGDPTTNAMAAEPDAPVPNAGPDAGGTSPYADSYTAGSRLRPIFNVIAGSDGSRTKTFSNRWFDSLHGTTCGVANNSNGKFTCGLWPDAVEFTESTE